MGVFKCVGFEPYTRLVRACCRSNSLTEPEQQAYELACNQFGEDNVSLQEDILSSVEHPASARRKDEIYTWLYNVVNVDDISQNNILDIGEIQRVFALNRFQSNYSLYIHWDKVTISNEEDQSTEIRDFFARVPLYTSGLSFIEDEFLTFMRTTFTRSHWNNGYTHSHMNGLNRRHPLKFNHYCLGDGPIRNTIHHLQMEPSDPEATMLFFWELDKLVHVESLRGVPYMRLMDNSEMRLTPCNMLDNDSPHRVEAICSGNPWIRDFLASFIRAEKLPLAFSNGYYQLGCSFKEFAVMLTNYYLKWWDAAEQMTVRQLEVPDYIKYNLFLKQRHLINYYIWNNKICISSGRVTDAAVPNDVLPFEFGDKSFPLIVEEDTTNRDYSVVALLPIEFVGTALSFILTSINSLSSQYEQETQANQVSKCSPFVCQGNRTQRGRKGYADKDATPIN